MRGELGVVLVVAAFLTLMFVVGRLRSVLDAEQSRKVLHVGMAATALAFPWLLVHVEYVVAAALATLTVSLVIRAVPALRSGFGRALYGVDRRSLGEVYFAAAVIGIFAAARGDAVSYVIPMLVLGPGDAAAALVGRAYGRTRYATIGGSKSWEGSIAFLIVTFVATLAALLAMTEIGRIEALLIALLIAFLCALLEGMAWDGLDNLIVPVAAFFLLGALRPLDAGTLMLAIAALPLPFVTMLLYSRCASSIHRATRSIAVSVAALGFAPLAFLS